MKKNSIIGVTLAIVSCLTAFAFSGCKDTISYEKYENADKYKVGSATFTSEEAVGIKEIELDWVGGTVEIEQSSSGNIQIIEEEGLSSEIERMHYYLDEREGVLSVKYCQAGLRGTVREAKKNLRIMIPTGVALEMDIVSAKVTMSSVALTDFSMENISGNFSAERIKCSRAELETVSGEMQVAELDAERLDVDTVSGNVSIPRLTVANLEAETVSGDLDFGIALKGRAEIESTSGEVTLSLLNGLSAGIFFKSGSGDFECKKRYDQNGSRYYIGVPSDGTADYLVEFESVSGDLIIL